ncbi:MAG TPA: DUF167 family protein [Bdellovibrionota bacterium]|nr:DUF167 family protein [Bdellovibrionota bacterium]
MNQQTWFEEVANGIVLKLLIQPKASRTEVSGLHGEPPRLKIRVAAPPVDGEANAELLHFLKKKLKVTSSRLQILRGETSKSKDVFCAGVSRQAAEAALLVK